MWTKIVCSIRPDIIFIVAFLSFVSTRKGEFKCPENSKRCLCRNTSTGKPKVANCSSRHLSKIPEFHEHYQKFIFSNNNLTSLTNSTFLPIAYHQLSELVIRNCSISFVYMGTFKCLPVLRVLDISFNKHINLIQLRSSLELINISKLDLSGIHHVKTFLNIDIPLKSLHALSIRSCQLKNLDPEPFETLPNLRELDISQNTIQNIDDLLLIRSIETLTATHSHLTKIPVPRNSSHLKTFNISNNQIQSFGKIRNFSSLINLYADYNPLKTLDTSTFSTLPKLQVLSLANIKTESMIFFGVRSRSLISLNIANSRFLKREYPDIFNESLNLESLTLTGIDLGNWEDEDLRRLFSPLYKNLKILYLNNTSITTLPKTAFSYFTTLQRLILSNNNISSWNVSTFPNISLTRLSLRNNNIKFLNKTSFPEMIWSNITLLDVQDNPFACTCDIHWFRQWMKGQYYKVAGPFGNSLLCETPVELYGTQLVDYDPTYEDCFPLATSMILAIIICVVSFLGIILLNCFVKPKDDGLSRITASKQISL